MFKIKHWNYCPFGTGIKLIFVCFNSVLAFQYFSTGNQIASDGTVTAAKVTVIVITNLKARLKMKLIFQSVYYFYDASVFPVKEILQPRSPIQPQYFMSNSAMCKDTALSPVAKSVYH